LISGSIRYKQAYDDAKSRLEEAEEEFTRSFEQKRYIMKEKNQMKQQKDEAEVYNSTVEDIQVTKRNHFLFELFHIQVSIDKKKKELAVATRVRANIRHEHGAVTQRCAASSRHCGSPLSCRPSCRPRLSSCRSSMARMRPSRSFMIA
jgi:chromosome segregation ATPase